MMCKLIECARQQVNINNEYKYKLRIINVFNFVNTVGEISTEIKAQLELERQQAHQEQNEIDNDLIKSLKMNKDIKKYLIGRIQTNNNLYNIISDEIKFVKKQNATLINFLTHLTRQGDKTNKEFRYNNKSEEEKK